MFSIGVSTVKKGEMWLKDENSKNAFQKNIIVLYLDSKTKFIFYKNSNTVEIIKKLSDILAYKHHRLVYPKEQ